MIHVCFGLYDADGCYSKFTGTTILSLFENCNTPPSTMVHILHDNTLTQDNRDKFTYLAGRYGQIVKFYNVEELCAEKIEMIRRDFSALKNHWLTVGAFYKCFIPDILPDIDKAIYLDSDIIANLDIAELWRVDLGEKILGVVTELSNGRDVQNQFSLVAAGIVKAEDYFNSGVMLMNLKLLRDEPQKIADGIKFIAQNPKYQKYMDQDVLNLCFSTRAFHLPTKFNRFADSALKENNQTCEQKIYHFVEQYYTLGLDMKNVIHRLWMKYFLKTPWFDEGAIGRLYAGIRQMHVELKTAMIQLSAIMSGKTRAFVILPPNLEATKQIFGVRPDEEIISCESPESLPTLIDAMNRSRGQKIFFVMLPGFPLKILTDAGFVYGGDFLNGFDFLSEVNGVSFDSHRLLKKM